MPRPALPVLCALITLCLPATAQQKRPAGQPDWRLRQLKSRLKLSDAQVEQVTRIYDDTRQQTEALKQAEWERIKKLLTPDQRALQEAHEKRQEENRKRQAEYRKYWLARTMGLDPTRLARELGLTPEQEQKLRETIDAANKQGIERYEAMNKELRGKRGAWGGRWNDEGYLMRWRELLDSGKADARKRIAALLDEPQKRKFEEWNHKADEQVAQSRRRQDAWRTRRAEQSRLREAQTPEGRLKARLAAALQALALPEDESAVLAPLIEKVLRYQASSANQLAALRAQLARLAAGKGDREALRGKVAALRKSAAAIRARLQALRDGLRELLTLDQEAKLIALEILE